jgi:hypothetical protein
MEISISASAALFGGLLATNDMGQIKQCLSIFFISRTLSTIVTRRMVGLLNDELGNTWKRKAVGYS